MKLRQMVAGALLVLMAVTASSQALNSPGIETLERIQGAFRDVARTVIPAVVEINVVSIQRRKVDPSNPFSNPFEFFFDRRRPEADEPEQTREFRQSGLGSGVVVRKVGRKAYVLSNDHVVGEADEIEIRLSDGRSFDAELVGRDTKSDLALVVFETGDDIPTAILGDSDAVQVGDWAIAIGNPLGFESTITAGIISAIGRQAGSSRRGQFNEYIQTDAAINQGNSGGALVNIRGEVVGINTWIASNTGGNLGLGFAIPINSARRVVDDFISQGKVIYGWLGINVGDPSREVAEELRIKDSKGTFVYSVFHGSPADGAGIKPGDFITRIDGNPMADTNQLLRTVAELKPGDRVRFQLVRYGNDMTVNVSIAARDEDEEIEARARSVWPGLAITPITDGVRDQLKLGRGTGDLVIRSVSPGSPADAAGFKAGDIIKSLNGDDVNTTLEFYRTLNETKSEEIVFNLYREGTRFVLGLTR